jgi:probable H4MPT-linked C1 transfer pathway protein
MPTDAIGLDIGGANLKAADATGRSLIQPFELWRYPERLSEELARIRVEWPDIAAVGVTMTGELCDCFETKRDGVRHILASVQQVFGDRPIGVWSVDGRFLSVKQAFAQPIDVAAANWHAQATFAGRFVSTGPAMLIDIGSTTTDVIPLMDGKPVAIGRTDTQRLASGELVYTGVRRTPVCAVLGSSVAAELFATTHDAYLVLGSVPEDPYDRSMADGRMATERYAHARLARMIGGDGEITSHQETQALAHRVLDVQTEMIGDAIKRAAARLSSPPKRFIVSGSGAWLAEKVIGETAECVRLPSLVCACAYALAVLLSESDR